MGSILKRKISIEKQVDDFLDQISEAGLLFKVICRKEYPIHPDRKP